MKPVNFQTFYARAGSHKKYLVYCLFVVAVVFCSWNAFNTPIETGPYAFVYPANFGNRIKVPADNPTTKQGVYLGRLLFYETRLSANNKISCGSCHQQSKAFTDGQVFSQGVDAVLTTRNSMSLVNLLWGRKFFWDGRAESLEGQTDFPLTNPHEMGQPLALSVNKISKDSTYPHLFKLVFGDERITGQRIKYAIAQFERTLISAGSLYDQYLAGTYQPNPQQLRGITLFKNCEHCHGGPRSYKEVFHNNGLDSVYKDAGVGAITGLNTDQGRFKVPTLRNIAVTAPYMHDGRFATLEEVIDHYSDHIVDSPSLSAFIEGRSADRKEKILKLSTAEKSDLMAFLKLLTDSAFLKNPAFADPNLIKHKL